KGAPLFISYNPAQVLKLAGKRYLTGPVIFYRTDGHSTIVSLTALQRNATIVSGCCGLVRRYYRKDGFWEAPTTASLLKC
ncbi:hypothetical protein R2O95_14315, partial [Faecalibacterium duncaniae]|nr:hypothetical protein [Faecalibacterium duncaniae]